MFEELMSRRIDFEISLICGFATGMVCTIFGLFLDRWLKRGESKAVPVNTAQAPWSGLTISQATNIGVRVSVGGDSRNTEFFWYVIILMSCIGYLFFRQEILNIALYLIFALVGLWAGMTFHSLYHGYLRGGSWFLYLAVMIFFPVLLVFVLTSAQAPEYAPQFFALWQPYVKAYGIAGAIHYGLMSIDDIGWLVFHVAGVAVLFIAIRNAALSMLFYTFVSNNDKLNEYSGWLVRSAARFGRKPLRGLVVLVILVVCAYWLVDGIAYMFWTQKLPVLIQGVFDQVLHGSQGPRAII